MYAKLPIATKDTRIQARCENMLKLSMALTFMQIKSTKEIMIILAQATEWVEIITTLQVLEMKDLQEVKEWELKQPAFPVLV